MFKTYFISLSAFVLITGCTQPNKVSHVQLEEDIQSLVYLSEAYQNGELTPLSYIKQSRILRKKIAKQEEYAGNGHTHTH